MLIMPRSLTSYRTDREMARMLGRFTFECRVACDTKEPKIEWFKDGREVPRDRQLYRDGLCQLMIDATGPDDTAKYSCRVTTEAGTTDTSATLRVKGSSSRVCCNL